MNSSYFSDPSPFDELKQIIIKELDKNSSCDSLRKIYTVAHTLVESEEGDNHDGV